MPTKRFQVNLYDVETTMKRAGWPTSLLDALEQAWSQDIGQREKIVSGKRRRLNDWKVEGGLVYLNFITFEFAGPGRVRQGQPAVPISMRNDESFSPETAILFDPNHDLAYVESTQTGMSPGVIARYCMKFAAVGTTYSLVPRVDDDSEGRARRFSSVKTIEMRVRMGPSSGSDREAGIHALQALGGDYQAEYINLEIKAGRRKADTLHMGMVRGVIDALRWNRASMPKLVVTGKEDEDDKLEPIDLIQHREQRRVDLGIDGRTRKVPHQTRWDALADMYLGYI